MKRKAENLNEFAALLGKRISKVGLSDREVARRAGISNALLSTLRNGHASPTAKDCVLLGWALNSNPLNFYEEISELLYKAGLSGSPSPMVSFQNLICGLDPGSQLWIYAPDTPDVRALRENQALSSAVKDKRIQLAIFSSIEHAQSYWESLPDSQTSQLGEEVPPPAIKTPREDLLTREGPLLVTAPDKATYTKIYSWFYDLENHPVFQLRVTDALLRFVRSLEAESKMVNLFEYATKEEEHGTENRNAIVIMYTRDYAELDIDHPENRRLYKAVWNNLCNNSTRYCYLNPALDDAGKLKGRYLFNNLYRKLLSQCPTVEPFNFTLIDVNRPELSIQPNTAIYTGQPSGDGTDGMVSKDNDLVSRLQIDAVLVEAPGRPSRFEKLNGEKLGRLCVTLLSPILRENNNEVFNWILQKRATDA